MDLRPLGTAEDLFALFARREYQANGHPPDKGRLGRGLIEPAFQGFGLLLAGLGELLPAGPSLAVQDRLYRAIQGGGGEPEVDAADPALRAAADLAREAERRCGRRPALACLLAHAPVDRQWLHLNPLMFRTALRGLPVVRGAPCRPRLVNAVDPFALDMLDAVGEGAYAGYMARAHLGFLRLTRARPAAGRLLTAGAGWPGIAWRILRLLEGGGELIMVLAGGVPATARGYYALREAVGRLCRRSAAAPMTSEAGRLPTAPGGGTSAPEGAVALPRDNARSASPAAVLARLGADADFAAFRASSDVGRLRSAWRLIEAWVLAASLDREGRAALEAGRLSPRGRAALAAAAAALGVPAPELGPELARDTPYRERFLSAALLRTVARGRPVVLLPLLWGRLDSVRVAFGPPACLLPAARGRARVLEPSGREEEQGAEAFARSFVASRLP